MLISAHKGHLIFPSQGEGNIIQQLHSVHSLRKALYHQYFISDFTIRTEINIRILSAGRPHFIQLNLLQSTFSGSSLLTLRSIGRKSRNKFLQLFDFFLFFLVSFLHLFNQKLAGFIPEIIVSGIQLNLSVINVCGMGADLIQEITVVRYHNHRIFEINQEFLQPGNGVQIQMVGGLVQ